MPELFAQAARIPVPGGKILDEHFGHVNSGTSDVSIAHMRSPSGWTEPGQTPDFDEYTVVLRGSLRVEHRDGIIDVNAGQSIMARKGEWVRYSTPGADGAEYIAVCVPAFTLDTAHRDAS